MTILTSRMLVHCNIICMLNTLRERAYNFKKKRGVFVFLKNYSDPKFDEINILVNQMTKEYVLNADFP